MNADLLQVQLTPPALEKRVGGADLAGVNVATQANVRNATIRKVRFIGILRFGCSAALAAIWTVSKYQAFVSARLRGTDKSASSKGKMVSRPPTGRSLLCERDGLTRPLLVRPRVVF